MKATFFETLQSFREWLRRNHDKERELLVGLHKKSSGRASITWPEAVDAALCYGWIDGVRRSAGSFSYTIRFTPRKSDSVWSAINIRRAKELVRMSLMQPAGLAAFQRRSDDKSAIYSYEQRKTAKLTGAYERKFRSQKRAWRFFQAQPPGYRRTVSYWVLDAQKEETRQRRLARLIDDSAHERRIAELRRSTK